MKNCGVFCLLVVAIAVVVIPTESEAVWQALVPIITSKIKGLWRDGDFDYMGHTCNYSVTPKIKRWQLYYKGRMWCPGWTPIRGEAETRSNSGVLGKTVTDFSNKAFTSGLITEEQAQIWINTH